MEERVLPIIWETNANKYGIACSFYDEYKIKAIAIGKITLKLINVRPEVYDEK